MMQCSKIFLLILAAFLAVASESASGEMSSSTIAPSWYGHADLMTVIIGALITIVLFFMATTLKKIDRNQTRLYEKIDSVCKQVDILQGEHNAMKSLCAAGMMRLSTDKDE